MNHYHIALLKKNSPLLTYKSQESCNKGEIVEIDIKNKIGLGVIISDCIEPDFECRELRKTDKFFGENQIVLADFIAKYYCSSYGESYGLFLPFKDNKKLEFLPINYSFNDLSLEQKKIFQEVLKKDIALLFGDTGSGKTEIYIHLIINVLSQNKSAIFLMPEISLTPQMEKRLKDIFGDIVGIWHSKISIKNKHRILSDLNEGKIRIIAGARSALFLPIKSLGLIIVDEEHDEAYKSQTRPRYNARDIALYLGKKNNIQILLGSATPSVLSYYNAKKNNFLLRLKGRYFKSQKEFIFQNHPTAITPFILDHIQKTLESKEQVVIFLPTRANFKTLLCQECGESIQCPFCSVDMSLHLKTQSLICHYCAHTTVIPKNCPSCGSNNLSAHRIGTAQVADELKEILPNAKISIFDKDHTNTQNKLKKILNDFNHHKIDILIGTQMISKGHDYHNINLAIVLGIDYILRNGDYKSYEKAISLIYQIAGRSGRKKDGKVIIQSLNTEVIKTFIKDYESFLEFEISHRYPFYPPFKRLALLNFSHIKQEVAENNMNFILEILKENINEKVCIVGFGKSILEKIAQKYRYHIFLRSDSHTSLLKMISCIKSYTQSKSFEIDIDPNTMI